MKRRWSLIALIVALAVALAVVIVYIVTGDFTEGKAASGKKPASPAPKESAAKSLDGDGWWPLHRSGTGRAGEHDAVPRGNAKWVDGPNGGAVQMDGKNGFVDTGAPVIDTAREDYSVAARVRLNPDDLEGMHTVISQDSDQASTFYLQYSGADERFAFSFSGARALAEKAGKPKAGHWYHLVGTYSQAKREMKIYVDGRLAGTRTASNPSKPSGNLVFGRAKIGGKPVDYWRGGMADVHVYGRELTADEVNRLSAREPD